MSLFSKKRKVYFTKSQAAILYFWLEEQQFFFQEAAYMEEGAQVHRKWKTFFFPTEIDKGELFDLRRFLLIVFFSTDDHTSSLLSKVAGAMTTETNRH